jgi:hypothetical protein
MLTEMQKSILRMAAKEPEEVRIDRINDAIKLIKSQSPAAFFHDTEKKADPDLAKRVFFDQPYSLMPDQYFRHVVPMRSTDVRLTDFKQRGYKILRGS